MHWQLATLALILLGFAAISGRIQGTSITAPMVFTAVGMLVGVEALGLLDPEPAGEGVKLLAEATLTVVLFADASRIDVRSLRAEVGVPIRLLGIGLPLTLVAGFAVAVVLLGGLGWPEALLLAVILAPTDAALGQAVVMLGRLPSRVRQSLNVESGLNDGDLRAALLHRARDRTGGGDHGRMERRTASRRGEDRLWSCLAERLPEPPPQRSSSQPRVAGWMDAAWLQVVPLAGAALAFGFAEAIGGSGFIAAFVGGAFFGVPSSRERSASVSYLIEEAGALLAAVTFIVFGAVLLAPALGDVTWQILVYSVLSLTLVRMLPVAISLVGTGARRPTIGFLGWFGPRGLASIVFALLLLEEGGLPNDELILTVTFVTVGLSVLAHGVTAAPLAQRYADWIEANPRPEPALLEAPGGLEPRWRARLDT